MKFASLEHRVEVFLGEPGGDLQILVFAAARHAFHALAQDPAGTR
jgi:hypothetical protein